VQFTLLAHNQFTSRLRVLNSSNFNYEVSRINIRELLPFVSEFLMYGNGA
jgi:hypothetical protein